MSETELLNSEIKSAYNVEYTLVQKSFDKGFNNAMDVMDGDKLTPCPYKKDTQHDDLWSWQDGYNHAYQE